MIIFQNEDIIVVNKPPGISVHNGTEESPDMIQWLLHNNIREKPYFVHRLDKETSGILLISKKQNLVSILQEQFQNKTTEKKYFAIVRKPLTKNTGQWMWPLSDKAEGRLNPQGKSVDRKECKTNFIVKKSNNYFSFLDCEILTGRQHQIRKHCALANHPIVGDERYNDKKYNQKIFEAYKVKRLFLHAYYLKIKINTTDFIWTIDEPDDFKTLILG